MRHHRAVGGRDGWFKVRQLLRECHARSRCFVPLELFDPADSVTGRNERIGAGDRATRRAGAATWRFGVLCGDDRRKRSGLGGIPTSRGDRETVADLIDPSLAVDPGGAERSPRGGAGGRRFGAERADCGRAGGRSARHRRHGSVPLGQCQAADPERQQRPNDGHSAADLAARCHDLAAVQCRQEHHRQFRSERR